MKLSLKWLKEWVNVSWSSTEMVQKLTMAGLEVEQVESINDDTVFDIEITPNRADCLSMLGLAREVAAIASLNAKFPIIKAPKPVKEKVPIDIDKKSDCLRYGATLIEDVTVGASPKAVQDKLASFGIRSINTAVDITNLLMIETGQPLHVFDYDKIVGGKIYVRRAKANEKIITLDGQERKLDEGVLIIADSQKPIAIAGIMGGSETEVNGQTKRILLEAAHFDMAAIRRATRKLGIKTDASYRFERFVDVHQTYLVHARACEMLLAMVGGKVSKRHEVNYAKPSMAKPLKLTEDMIKDCLGAGLPMRKAKDYLSRLGFSVRQLGKALLVKSPTWRYDISIPEDLIEELARLVGYDKWPTTMPIIPTQNIPVDQTRFIMKDKAKSILAAFGIDEAITISLTSQKALSRCRMNGDEAIRVSNPLSQDGEILRTAILPTLLPSLVLNIHRGQKDVRLYEWGHVFTKQGEREQLLVLMTGRRHKDWRLSRRDVINFEDVSGLVMNLSEAWGVKWTLKAKKEQGWSEPHVQIFHDGNPVGGFGLIAKDVLKDWDLKMDGVWGLWIDVEAKPWKKPSPVFFKSLPEYPFTQRDLSLALPLNVSYEDIEKVCRTQSAQMLKTMDFVELYEGDKLPPQHKGYMVSLVFGSDERTLTDLEVNEMMNRIIKEVTLQLKAILR